MTPKKRHSKTDSVPESDFGGQEFYDEDEESRLLAMRERASKGGQDDPHVASGQRLQKVLAHAGVASRRACEQLIADGRVSVDGITVTEPGVRVDPLTQEIRVDGGRILTNPELITLMLHKPAGVVTTMEDPGGRPTVAQRAEVARLYAIGVSVPDICARFNITKNTVIRLRKQAGVPQRERGLNEPQGDEAEVMYASGKSLMNIAKHFSTGVGAVRGCLLRRGVRMRRRNGA